MKIDKTKLLQDCVSYWDKLSTEEKDFLWRFELQDKLGMTPVGDPPLTSKDLKRFLKRRTAKQSDILNNSNEKIIKHYYDKKRKPSYSPADYPWAEDEKE